MDYRKVSVNDGFEVELDPDVAAEIEAAQVANYSAFGMHPTALKKSPTLLCVHVAGHQFA
jgi:hypothetical protein